MKRVLGMVLAAGFMLSLASVFAQEGAPPAVNPDPATAMLDKVSKQLELTDDQQAKIKEILTSMFQENGKIIAEGMAKIKDLKTGADATAAQDNIKKLKDEAMATIQKNRTAAHDQIAALLTDVQKQKFVAMRKAEEAKPAPMK